MLTLLVFAPLCAAGLAGNPALIPQPVSLEIREGRFLLAPGVPVRAAGPAALEARKLIAALARGLGFELKLSEAVDGDGISIALDKALPGELGPEGYMFDVAPNRVEIRASSSAGLFYGIQTLRQLLPPESFARTRAGKEWPIPCLHIVDYPRFVWRGLLIDPARHFLPKQDVLRFIDAMALHKLNRLQIHLTDDQGWRIEVRKYPRLTEVGAWRDETLVGHLDRQPWKFDGRRHGGFYRQEDIREIVRYAADRHVTVVPEIEMPGHARAAIAAYPELGVFPEKQRGLRPWTSWGVSEDIFAPRPRTISFLRDVLAEVMALFPGPFIHIGGDEAVKTQWKASQEIQQMIRELGLRNESELQAWFTGRIGAFLSESRRRLVGWQEILEGGRVPDAVVMSWRGEQAGIAAARAGHDVVMAPTSHTYFDYYQGPPESEPLAIGGSVTLDGVYGYEPLPAALTAQESRHVLGAQAQLWSEYIPDAKHLEYMTYPRACALAEVLWSPREGRSLDAFLTRRRPTCSAFVPPESPSVPFDKSLPGTAVPLNENSGAESFPQLEKGDSGARPAICGEQCGK